MDSVLDYLSPHAVVGLIVAFCTYVLVHILRMLAAANDDKNEQNPLLKPDSRKKEGKTKSAAKKSSWNSNRGSEKSKAAYSPPWIVTALKGHTGQVLDIDFSSSGKYLASCGEEDADADADTSSNSSSSSDSSKESAQFSPEQSPRQTKGLSRRQRKNRLRRDDSSPEKKKVSSIAKKMSAQSKIEMINNKKKMAGPISQFDKFKLDYSHFYSLLFRYLLTDHERSNNGYPVALHQGGNKVTVYYRIEQWSAKKTRAMKKSRYGCDVHAAEFVPIGNTKHFRYYNSSDSESSSSSSSEDLYHMGHVMYDYNNPWTQLYYKHYNLMPMVGPPSASEYSVERSCVRCGNGFFTTHSEYLTQEKCCYHWGKPQIIPGQNERYYSCCGRNSPEGCTSAPLHVWNGSVEGDNGPYSDYVQTAPSAKTDRVGVYAMDCEMCYTVAGLEVTKVSVVAINGQTVYNAYIKPTNEIVDYNTRFSGITEKDMVRPNVKHLKQVQSDLKKFITSRTILIGHGLDNDLRALKLHHTMCVDTAFVFPHYKGLPYKMSLKHLTAQYLKRQVQTSSGGHDSYEDASACMELMLWRVRKDSKL